MKQKVTALLIFLATISSCCRKDISAKVILIVDPNLSSLESPVEKIDVFQTGKTAPVDTFYLGSFERNEFQKNFNPVEILIHISDPSLGFNFFYELTDTLGVKTTKEGGDDFIEICHYPKGEVIYYLD